MNADTLRLRADAWYPYNGNPDSDYPGYMIELADEILNKAGHQLDYQLMPWSRSLVQARKGSIDCIAGAFRDDAPDFLYPEVSMGRDDVGFFVMEENRQWRFTSEASLAEIRVAVISGYSYGEQLDGYIRRNRHSPYLQVTTGNDPLERNIKLLLAHRVELLIESPNVLNATLDKMGLAGNLVEVGRMNNPRELYIACSPQSSSAGYFVQLLSKGVQRMRASGRLQQILARYGLDDWEQ
ncbi:transporter substrate-binding domain-containing protein [Aestuariirhabdus sp. Z084]|uniref:substrate-binding periplasmic protein n=1 Tax=Aestuariirhabdus haliotis TaxID=2918751 RepID=UPI00201B3D2B|nr:transporter substrate-binding domain-containing protein [Aestuariirhabdus haliotis]MCL6415462.1 transporter substrate-binding domain-containing protein [Aestuariirhabdus haliotis]MCL6419333.1 transporter substrate-binding domain-containing protein [Aestuariirhabdus haliotis]